MFLAIPKHTLIMRVDAIPKFVKAPDSYMPLGPIFTNLKLYVLGIPMCESINGALQENGSRPVPVVGPLIA